jgi:hypothetical protein
LNNYSNAKKENIKKKIKQMERKKEKKIINLPESIDLDDTEQNKRANEK